MLLQLAGEQSLCGPEVHSSCLGRADPESVTLLPAEKPRSRSRGSAQPAIQWHVQLHGEFRRGSPYSWRGLAEKEGCL